LKNEKNRKTSDHVLESIESDDLIKFGLIPEFVGRLPVVAVLKELNQEALVEILIKPKNSLVKQFHALFEMEGVELEFREEALQLIAKNAIERKMGARGLRAILENILLDTMYDLPSTPGVVKVVVDEQTVKNNGKPILIYSDGEKENQSI
jgi:ATP-dependent Clp protease ATP-binding subunit ClpX